MRWILKDLRRDRLAFTIRIASALVGFCSGFAPFCELLDAGFIGCIGVGIMDRLPKGWVFIGPVIDLLLGILDNPARPLWFKQPIWFESQKANRLRIREAYAAFADGTRGSDFVTAGRLVKLRLSSSFRTLRGVCHRAALGAECVGGARE